MTTKLKAMQSANERQLADVARDTAPDIWQAGLGALARPQWEGGDAFANLLQDGTDAQQMAGEKSSSVTQTMVRFADSIGKQASVSWERLGSVVEDRVSRSLHGLGIPTQDDIHALTIQIEKLNRSINMLLIKEMAVARASAAAEKKGAKKPVARTAKKSGTSVRPMVGDAAGAAVKKTGKTQARQ